MVTTEELYSNYDNLIRKVCEPYDKFLSIGAQAIPENTRSVCDLGIGTGNFMAKVQEQVPNAEFHGIDKKIDLLNIAKSRISKLKIYNCEAFSEPLPKVDYFISSLMTHHFDSETRIQKLTEIISNSNGFVNFDTFLFNGDTLKDNIGYVIDYAKQNIQDNEIIEKIIEEMEANDNPMPFEEQREVFESQGLNFEVLAKKVPYAVYKVSRPIPKKE